ncbi:4-oxalomesaconate tautomerase [Burkholderia stabilis]|uniref:4-oxalomesaconate tautomerase n=1 Tax=Burkholderia stabilis TaxID=95485 RepID=UPI0015913FC5|nr:4-oxalomesaconate tautomerase [Burkholderia stabilis]
MVVAAGAIAISPGKGHIVFRKIPCMLMRGGTSRGAYLLASDLPADPVARDNVLLSIMGSPHPLQIDGIGGGHPLTSKVAIAGPSTHGADIDCLVAQVSVDQPRVDIRPNCGNILAGVAPFAIETGLVQLQSGETVVRIFNLNTCSTVEAQLKVERGQVVYDGDTCIDGVPGSGAPIVLTFIDIVGGSTGRAFPTGTPIDYIDGVPLSCIDVAMPTVLLPALALGKQGDERPEELESDIGFCAQVESIRQRAAVLMGLGGAPHSVIPKVAMLSRATGKGHIRSRYFTPWKCHSSHAVTGAIAVASACALPGTIAAALSEAVPADGRIRIEHPSGSIEIEIEIRTGSRGHDDPIVRAGLIRTARPILDGFVRVPEDRFALMSSVLPQEPRQARALHYVADALP